MGDPRPIPLLLVFLAVAAGVIVLIRTMHRMKPRAQFLVLVVLGITIGFTFLAMVQLPHFPPWLGVSFMVVVLVASPFAIQTFVRSLMQENEPTNETPDNLK
ncbi:MAG: hypothetical protein WA857_03265 [Candidatus Acidiferrum sp.]